MIVIKPDSITDAVLTSSIPEPDTARGEVAWSAGTYALGDQAIKTSTHKVYEVVADPSTTDDPEVGVNKTPATWVEVGATNRYKMFDSTIGYQSEAGNSLSLDFDFGRALSSIAVFNMMGAETVNVKLTDPSDGVVYDRDINIRDNSIVEGWHDYFFKPIEITSRFILNDLPTYPLATININATGVDIAVGEVVLGDAIDLGVTEYGTGWQGLDFSVKERDQFGNFRVVRGRTADLLDYDITVPKAKFTFIKNTLKSLASVPAVWIGNENDESDGTAVFGYYRDAQINISSPSIIDMTIQVEGLI